MVVYFSVITQNHWTPKNQAHRQAKDAAKYFERRIIKQNRLPGFKKEFREVIDQINENNPRCKPLELEFWQPHHDKDIRFYISGVFEMRLYLAKPGEQE